jgi:hypothetical protein
VPYTTPPTFVAGTVLAAADLNILSTDVEYLYGVSTGISFSGVQLRRAANQSISTSTDTNISWDTENLDYGGWWSSGTAITVPAGAIPAGYTSIMLDVVTMVKFATDGTGKRRVTWLKNGSSFGSWKTTSLDDDVTTIVFPEAVEVAAGDTIAVQVWQNSGSSLNVTEGRITVERRGPTV